MEDIKDIKDINECAQVLLVGHNFPLGRNPGREAVRAEFGDMFLDLVYYIERPEPRDVAYFNNGAIHYGVYEEADVPFFLLQLRAPGLEPWTMESSLNFHKLQEGYRQEWCRDAGANAVMLYLVDAETNILLGMRLVGISLETADQVRGACPRQIARYGDMGQVDEVITGIMAEKDTGVLLKHTALKPLKP
jgi:hypothetical protein